MIRLENVIKTYSAGKSRVNALNGISVKINEGEFVVINGPSGSGKTTLLMVIAGMLRPTSGNVIIAKENIYTMSTKARTDFRADNIGFIFQMFHLIAYLNVLENVFLADRTGGSNEIIDRADKLITQLGLSHRTGHKPSQLSAGEKQRTAIARAMVNEPKIILADEPTGNLDTDSAAEVFGHLSEFHRRGNTVVVVTHGIEAQQFADRTIYVRNGRIEN